MLSIFMPVLLRRRRLMCVPPRVRAATHKGNKSTWIFGSIASSKSSRAYLIVCTPSRCINRYGMCATHMMIGLPNHHPYNRHQRQHLLPWLLCCVIFFNTTNSPRTVVVFRHIISYMIILCIVGRQTCCCAPTRTTSRDYAYQKHTQQATSIFL